MLVKFVSSQTGELIMFADVAHQLLMAVGKEGTPRGVFTAAEMLPAAQALRDAVKRAEARPVSEEGKESEEKEKPIALAQRAWPLIDMLERTARGGERANILWEAPRDF